MVDYPWGGGIMKGFLRWNSWQVVVAACSGTSREEMAEATCGGQYLNEASWYSGDYFG